MNRWICVIAVLAMVITGCAKSDPDATASAKPSDSDSIQPASPIAADPADSDTPDPQAPQSMPGTVISPATGEIPPKTDGVLRIATFNVSLYGKAPGQMMERLADGKDQQAERIAAIVQTVRPDVLLLNEIDFDEDAATVNALNDLFFAVGNTEREGHRFEHVRSFPSNTGVDSGLDLDDNGQPGQPNDAWGYGVYEGQYAMAVLSRFPIDDEQIRTFQTLRWASMPDPQVPVDPKSGETYYDEDVWNQLRLSSKNHVDVPVRIGERTLHVLASHPTPPVFDGPEDHNGCRNHDEIRFWTDYLDGSSDAWMIDDAGLQGGFDSDDPFVIMGDLNADPVRGDGRREAIINLLEHDRTTDPQPIGAAVAEKEPSDSVSPHATADFGRNGWMRVDYVVPDQSLELRDSGVFWPGPDSPQRYWITASDHRLVWIDVVWP
ncbi:endonuclease/exonuclease/phosphatase family protein [Crateriforma spongiae]|uniref:endonuclease/exonuclease/phosphatase family protein n=1 Tax=Crateriforma spongiae TaxID=2724528 RepID=UPI0039B0F9EA